MSARRPCIDCDGQYRPAAKQFEHRPTCPVLIGIDQAAEGDREWFESRPGAWVRDRDATWAEVVEWERLGGLLPARDVTDVTFRVQVMQMRPGIRTRSLRWFVGYPGGGASQ